jgi:hypothetical protein
MARDRNQAQDRTRQAAGTGTKLGRRTWLGLALVVGLAARLPAQTVTLQDVADTGIKQDSPNKNFGAQASLTLNQGAGRVLVRFDTAAISAAVGSGSLASAQLQLYIGSNAANWGATGRTVDVYRVVTAWTESGATWNCAQDTNPANRAADCATQWNGGTTADDASDTVVVTNASSAWIQFDVTADVQAFLAGTTNDGWLLQKTDEGQAGRVDLVSKEGAAGQAPRLVLTSESAAVDMVPPSLAIVAPSPPVVVNVPSPQIAVTYRDGGSGVDTGSLRILLDGQDLTARCTIGGQGAACTPPPLAAGTHGIVASLSDHAGNSTTTTASFRLLLGPGIGMVTLPVAADTYLTGAEPDREHGRTATLRLAARSGPRRALVQFDQGPLAAALAGSQLVSAQLELSIAANGNNWGASGRTVGAYPATAAWSESAATWDCPADTNLDNDQPDCAAPWNGGAFAATPTATALLTRGLAGTVGFDVTADVAAFLAGTANDGWLLKDTDETKSGRVDFVSRESASGQAAQLVVVFQIPSADTTPPTIVFVSPAASGAVLATATPTLSATLSDDLSGVDPGSVTVKLDGSDVTAGAQRSATGVAYTPPAPLADGLHVVLVGASDRAGNHATASAPFTIDTSPPTIAFNSPTGDLISPNGAVPVSLSFADAGAGVDEASLALSLDGADVTSTCTVGLTSALCQAQVAASGSHTLLASVLDLAGNRGSATLAIRVTLDVLPPAIAITSPADGTVTRNSTMTIAGTATDDGQVAGVTVNGQNVTLAGGAFATSVALVEGPNRIVANAIDTTGKTGAAAITVTLDTTAPVIAIATPSPGQVTNQSQLQVTGTVADASAVALVTVDGTPATLSGNQFSGTVALVEGANTIAVHAEDAAGNPADAGAAVTLYSLPAVTITAPVDLSFLAATTVDVAGTVSDPASQVQVNGVAATVSGTGFVASGVPLVEGGNLLTAVATDRLGHPGSATINVVRDLTPPHLSLDLPANGTVLATATTHVSGLVNDIVPGTVNAPQVGVTVNGIAATVMNRSFDVQVPLQPGANTLLAVATDAAGNVAQAQVTVTRAAPAGAHLELVSGDGQSAVIGSPLGAPLVVKVVDGSGAPVQGVPVTFRLLGGDGSVTGGRRDTVVASQAGGTAQVAFTLGNHAGVGNQRVEASAPLYGAPITFAETALPGAPAFVAADSGGNQYGVAGQQLPRPLVAVVTDSGFNRLAGVPVSWSVVQGAGTLPNGTQQQVIPTDSDGRAITLAVLDPAEGEANTVVVASVQGLSTSPVAAFSESGRVAGDPAGTAVSGVVLDNSNLPIAGVTVRVKDAVLAAVTDANGYFRIAGAPVGSFYLIVDGSTAARPGSWPDLEFVVTTIPGRETTLGMPIFLLPLDQLHGLFVDELHGGTLTLAALPGFALQIAPGSVTFPGGAKSGTVSVTTVHSDKVPMVPNFGQQPRLIVTIQPAGARFDPPARLTLPNVEGLAPGRVTDFYSFDHDLGYFVSIGPATVSDDGMTIVSNPGVGIVKAGWHCGGDPDASGTVHNCPVCQQCAGPNCVADNTQVPPQTSTNQCVKEVCAGGSPVDRPLPDLTPLPDTDPHDCKKDVCLGGQPGKIATQDEEPVQIPGNCFHETCPPHLFPNWPGTPDLSDAPPGFACCQAPGPQLFPDGPQTYSVASQCCSLSGQVIAKGPPIADLSQCPNRHAAVPTVPHFFDGCSLPTAAVFSLSVVFPPGFDGDPDNPGFSGDPDNPAGAPDTLFSQFNQPANTPGGPPTGPCDLHDACYQTCDDGTDNEQRCNTIMMNAMVAVCQASKASDVIKSNCMMFAQLYYTVLVGAGFPAYDEDQSKWCQCC